MRQQQLLPHIDGTFSTGIDINNLHYIIFTESYKAYSLIRQSIGRGLRNYKDKKHLVIIDIIDNLGKYSKKHASNRMEIYKEQKFIVKTIKKSL